MLDAVLLAPVTDRILPLLEQADRLAADFAARVPAHDRDNTCPVENFPPLIRAGFHALTVPQRFGGPGLDLLETLLVQERLACGDAPTALILGMTLHLIGGADESGHWPEARLQALCRAILERGALINSVASEPELGSPSRGGLPATVAQRSGDGYRISGRKTFATGAPVLTHLLVQASLDGHILEFALPADRAGIRSQAGTWDVLGMRATASLDLVLEDVPAHEEDLLRTFAPGRLKGGHRTWFYLVVAATYLGVAAAARKAAVEYAVERHPTNLEGRPIADLESVRTLLGRLEGDLVAARSLLYSLAGAWVRHPDQRERLSAYVGLAKVRCTEAAVLAADLAMRVAGGASMSRSLPFERLLRDARAGLFHPPNEAAALAGLGQALCSGFTPR
ncbi:MAG: acyl-CoA dehydrogenase family protein [Candidatus Eremiobacterota bacterium]